MPTLPNPEYASLVEPADFSDTGRGLAVTRDVAEGEELLAIPLAHCWHAAASRAAPELMALQDAGVELSDYDANALFLLMERSKAEKSTRWVHLQELPAAYDSTLFWSDADLQELKGSTWLGLATRFSEEAASDWAALQASLGTAAATLGYNFIERHSIAYQDYLWAYATLKSRAAEAVVNGQPGTRLMAPAFDLFNHSDAITPGTSHFFDDTRKLLVVRASRPYRAGEQAFISYGHASNGSLLLAGGFVLPANAFDTVEVCLTSLVDASRLTTYMMAAPDAPHAHEHATFEFLQVPDDETVAASDGGCAPFTTRHLLTLSEPLPTALLTYVRLDRLSEDDFGTHSRKAQKDGKSLAELVRAATAPSDAAPLDALNELLSLAEGGGSSLPYLALFKAKATFWGHYLLSQWGIARALAVDQMGTMQQEAAALRDTHAYSIPTVAALRTLARHAPILELGAGNGHWASLLQQEGVDVLAFDTASWSDVYADASAVSAGATPGEGAALMGERADGAVSEGGPEVAAQHSDRALMLMWPDYDGAGSYASRCLANYAGETLLLVGEWRGRTYGAYGGDGKMSADGASFSPDFQRQVEAEFELVELLRLPSWPLSIDCLAVWRRAPQVK